jgi:hypothetical protein
MATTIDLTLVLIVVELVLLVPTLLLLILGQREERGRRALMKEMSRTAKMVAREEYFGSVRSSMQAATKTIRGSITGSQPKTAEQEEQVEKLVDEIKRAKARGISIQYVLPKSQDRLSLASRYREAGSELRFHPGLVVSDLRYVVFDNTLTVIGLPSVAGKDEPTREGYLIPSEGLAEIFRQQFESKWNAATPYDDYMREVLLEIRSHNPNVSTQLLSAQLKVPESEVCRVLGEEEEAVSLKA